MQDKIGELILKHTTLRFVGNDDGIDYYEDEQGIKYSVEIKEVE